MKGFLVFIFMVSHSAFAMLLPEPALVGGVQTTSVENVDGEAGFLLGVLGYVELGSGSFVRTGAIANTRNFETTVGAVKVEAATTNLDAPLTYMYKPNDLVGVFGGLRLGINLTDDCTTSSPALACTLNSESLYYGGEFGVNFFFTPDAGIDVAFDMGFSDILKNSKWENSLVISGFWLL